MSWNQSGAVLSDTAGLDYIDGLYGYAIVLTRNHAEAEDLVQETYVRAIQAMGRLRADSNIKSWFFTILRNIWLNQLRRRRSGPQMVDMDAEDSIASEVPAPTQDSLALYVTKVEREEVREAIMKLPREFREIIVLREYEELSYQEIANHLNCPAGTVMSRLARARSKLRSLLLGSQKRVRGGRDDVQ